MIKYTLKCDNGHAFESWFQSAVAFDKLAGAGHIGCQQCGSSAVSKAIMAPRVRPARSAASADTQGQPKDPGTSLALNAPQSEAEAALAKMRQHVEENSDYVGANFTKEAREMHLGDAPERSIYGSANAEEAKALIEDGVPVVPLPFMPKAKTN
ncbi:DUF1178 family protein [Ascidiaceihabitans sp.]|uniref:DUF1178 family protein n=1 Tax=Ascidiaceihabitans sp. TaxID=1872644 RepID=UPI003298A3E1